MFIASTYLPSFAPLGAICPCAKHCAPDGARSVFVVDAINMSLLRSGTQRINPVQNYSERTPKYVPLKTIRSETQSISPVQNYSHRSAFIGSTFVARKAGM